MTDLAAVAIPATLLTLTALYLWIGPNICERVDARRFHLAQRRRRRAIRRHTMRAIDLSVNITKLQHAGRDDEAEALTVELRGEQERRDYATNSEPVDWLPRGPVFLLEPSDRVKLNRMGRAARKGSRSTPVSRKRAVALERVR